MTTELEQEFFKVFGIEPTIYSLWDSKETQIKNFKSYEVYPEITDRVLLELICIYSKYTIFCLPINACDFEEKWTYEKLKNYILKELICLYKANIYNTIYKANIYNTNQKLQSNIQQLFKEGE